MPQLTLSPSFKKRFGKKTPKLQGSILKCIEQLSSDPRHPGLHTHKIRGTQSVFEAYMDRSNRLTFCYGDDGEIKLLNHCNHDIIKHSN